MSARGLELAILLSVLYAQGATAYWYRTCEGNQLDWDSNNQTVRGHTVSFEQQAMHDALQTVVNRFNLNPSKFRLNLQFNDGSVGLDNGQNESWFSPSQDVLDERPGVTMTYFKCSKYQWHLVETDVILQGDFSLIDWTYTDDRSSLSAYDGGNRALRSTLTHEFGHVAGLLHTIETYGVMGDSRRHSNTNGNRARAYLGEDGAGGVVELYGTASIDIEDVGVAHWRYVSGGPDPVEDYSEHARTRIFDLEGYLLDYETRNGERHYEVEQGQSIQVQFSYENNGQDVQEIDVGYYLSGNNTITTGDLPLGTHQYNLGRNTVYTAVHTVKIPAWIPSGFYFVGAIIDYNKKLTEQTSRNNATFIGIKVLPSIDQF